MQNIIMQQFHLLALTHRSIDLADIGRFHLAEENRTVVLERVKNSCGLSELMYLSTCNRVEFLFVTDATVDRKFIAKFFQAFNAQEAKFAEKAELFSGEAALQHLFEVSSSLDSLVVGEREIITQVRNSYEQGKEAGLTGDTLRILVRKAIETAKAVYTQTNIARNPVSVVSLAYRKLRDLNVSLDARILFIGSGVTNTSMARYLRKHGFTKFTVFNRTLSNAQLLAEEIGGTAFPLTKLSDYHEGFDVIVTCTGADYAVITPEIYHTLAAGDRSRKVVIDLAVPNDLDPEVLRQWDVNLIAVNNLQDVAGENLRQREQELDACRSIIAESIATTRQELRERKIELAMSEVPRKVKEIRETAVNAVFAKEISGLDNASKEVLDRILNYVEKKYISVPMKLAREILAEEVKEA